MTGFSSSAGSPAPTRFSARTRNKYEFPWNSLEALKECSEGETVPAVTHWPRPLVTSHFSMTNWITLDPPSVSGTSHEIVIKSLLKSTTCKFLGGPGGSAKNQKRQFIKLLQLSTLSELPVYYLWWAVIEPWVCLCDTSMPMHCRLHATWSLIFPAKIIEKTQFKSVFECNKTRFQRSKNSDLTIKN